MKLINITSALLLMFFMSNAWPLEIPRYRLLLQVSEGSLDKLNLALNNAKNAQKEFGPENIEIEIVVFGRGVRRIACALRGGTRCRTQQRGDAALSGFRAVADRQ